MRRGSGVSSHGDMEDRLQRALQENLALKHERSELHSKLKRVETQYRRLTADLRPSLNPARLKEALSLEPSTLPPISTPHGGLVKASSTSRIPLSTSSTAAARELQSCREDLVRAQEEVRRLRAVQSNGEGGAAASLNAAVAAQHTLQLQQQQLRLDEVVRERDELRRQLQLLQGAQGLPVEHQQLKQQRPSEIPQTLEDGQASIRLLEEHYRKALDGLTRERDALALRLKLLEVEMGEMRSTPAQGLVNPESIVQLQGEVREKSNQVSLLHSRLQLAQGQVETLKGECGRLVQELQLSHTDQADIKRQLFQVEQEKCTLAIQSGRVGELEGALNRKSGELVLMEKELLKTIGSLQTCHRETEEAVRREYSARIVELQEMRDVAESERREKERQLLQRTQEKADVERHVEALREDMEMYRCQAAKAERERAELSRQLALAGHASSELADPDVHRAVAVAAIKRRASRVANSTGLDGEAQQALELYESLQWDESWERDQLREALAAAALDMELAETRCTQMAEQAEQMRSKLKGISEERDILLEENMELRRRVTHVQTVVAKQQLATYRAAAAAADKSRQSTGRITLCIRQLVCEGDNMLRALDLPDANAAVNLFFTLDGLASYDTLLSPAVHSLQEPLDILFEYDELDTTEVTVAELQRSTFTIQLHQVDGTSTSIVGMAELPGMALLACREVSVDEVLALVDGEGKTVARMAVEMCCSRLMLPVLLGQPLQSASLTLSAEEVKSALVALRSIRFLRVQIFRAEGLIRADDSSPPHPYVFYTACSPVAALSCIRDTTVRPSNSSATTDPVFDADPTDHRVVVDSELLRFIAHGAIVFVLFDEKAKDVQANLGMVEVPLHPLLQSPQTCIRRTETLHPQGLLSFGVSWVTSP